MMFEFCASAGCGISKEIASKEISLFNSFYSMSRTFKYHKKSENVNFEETNNAFSFLVQCLLLYNDNMMHFVDFPNLMTDMTFIDQKIRPDADQKL